MEAAEPVATVVRKVTSQRIVINPRTWTMLLAEIARRLAISAGTAPNRRIVSVSPPALLF